MTAIIGDSSIYAHDIVPVTLAVNTVKVLGLLDNLRKPNF
jgi:hypothetical protein